MRSRQNRQRQKSEVGKGKDTGMRKGGSLYEGDPPCSAAIPPDLVFTPLEVQRMLKLGRSQTYELFATNAIRTKRIGRNIRIGRWDLLAFLEAAPSDL